MRCPNCNEDLFPGQARCDKCGTFVRDADKKKKKDPLIKEDKEKEEKTWH